MKESWGVNNENRIRNRINRLIQLKSAITMTSSSQMKLPVSARLGFNNLMHFIAPDPFKIELKTEEVVI
jgi:hypothetical protein